MRRIGRVSGDCKRRVEAGREVVREVKSLTVILMCHVYTN